MSDGIRHHLPVSKTKCALYLIPCLLAGLYGPYATICAIHLGRWHGITFIIWILLSPLIVPICGTAIVSLGRKLFDPKAGLTITDEGLINDSSPFSRNYLRWSEVGSIHLTAHSIEIRSHGPEGFSTIKPEWMSSSKPRTKINISNDCLKASNEEIAEALRTHQSGPIIDERKIS
jgi:hypothetical protein